MSDVVNEIKDESTRQSLQVLPYDITYREPTEEDVKFVANFAKRTGDFGQLSVTDMRVLALVVRLEKEINNGVNLKEAPSEIKVLPTKAPEQSKDVTLRDMQFFGYSMSNNNKILQTKKDKNEENFNEKLNNSLNQLNENIKDVNIASANLNSEQIEECKKNEIEEIFDELAIDDEEGWITKENCEKIRKKLMGIKIEEDTVQLTIACITGDFAMQNVLLQMGLNVISPNDGLRIRQTRQFVMRCFACFKINPPTATQFCKFCGNMKTLKRVSLTVNQDGTTKLHINLNKPINIRGSKYSLPTPHGGKHTTNPILCEDQHMPQQRKSKIAIQEKKLLTMNSILNDPDYLVRSNPFSVNDVYSRASRVSTHQRKIINPNETRKPTGNKKKKKNRYN